MKYSLALLIVSSLILTGCTQSPVSDQSGSTTAAPTSAPSSVKQTLRQLLGAGVTQKCTWTSAKDDGQVLGDIILDQNKFKQTVVTSDADGQEFKLNILGDGQWYYLWNSQTPNQGIKMKFDLVTTPAPQTDSSSQQLDLDSEVDYTCTPAAISDQDFTLPPQIKFVDITSGVPDVQDLLKSIPGTVVEE